MGPCWHPNLQGTFELPCIHNVLFVSLACSSSVPVICSDGVPVVFRQKLFLNASVFPMTTRNTTNLKVLAGCPQASKQHIFLA